VFQDEAMTPARGLIRFDYAMPQVDARWEIWCLRCCEGRVVCSGMPSRVQWEHEFEMYRVLWTVVKPTVQPCRS
jgi:hypothetical protein